MKSRFFPQWEKRKTNQEEGKFSDGLGVITVRVRSGSENEESGGPGRVGAVSQCVAWRRPEMKP